MLDKSYRVLCDSLKSLHLTCQNVRSDSKSEGRRCSLPDQHNIVTEASSYSYILSNNFGPYFGCEWSL
jgi:hypothetical protein